MVLMVPERARITSECDVAPPARYLTPASSSPSVMPVAAKNASSEATRSSVVSTRDRSCPAAMAFSRSASSRGARRPWIVPPRHLIAHAAIMPSGVPPVPSSKSTPVPSRAAMIAPATSPSVMSWIRAPAARTSEISSACRGRSRMTTVTSCEEHALALATLAMLCATGASRSTTSGADGQHGDRVWHPVGGQPGAVDRVHGDVTGGPAAVADLFAVEEHGGVILLALADHHHAVHRDRVDEHAHRVHRGTVGAVLVPTAHPPGGGHGAGLGDPDEFHGEVAVGRVSGRLRRLAHRDPGLAWDAVGLVLCHGRRLPSGSNTSERRPRLARPRLVRRGRGEPRPGAFEPL